MLNIPHICLQYPSPVAHSSLTHLLDLPLTALPHRRLQFSQLIASKEKTTGKTSSKNKSTTLFTTKTYVSTLSQHNHTFLHLAKPTSGHSITLTTPRFVQSVMNMRLFGDIVSEKHTKLQIEEYEWGSYFISLVTSPTIPTSLMIVKELNGSVVVPIDKYEVGLHHQTTALFGEIVNDVFAEDKGAVRRAVDRIVSIVQKHPEVRKKVDQKHMEINYSLIEYESIRQYLERNHNRDQQNGN